jgi:hypothetical protein
VAGREHQQLQARVDAGPNHHGKDGVPGSLKAGADLRVAARRGTMKARGFPVLLALVLVALFSAGSAAEESSDKVAPDSPGDARAVEAFFDELIARQLRDHRPQ